MQYIEDRRVQMTSGDLTPVAVAMMGAELSGGQGMAGMAVQDSWTQAPVDLAASEHKTGG